MNMVRTLLALFAINLLVSGCFLTQSSPGDQIIGKWKTDLAGFPVVYEYTETTFGMDSHPPTPYTIEGDVISFESTGNQARSVEFPSDGVMIQTDLETGIKRTFTREP